MYVLTPEIVNRFHDKKFFFHIYLNFKKNVSIIYACPGTRGAHFSFNKATKDLRTLQPYNLITL